MIPVIIDPNKVACYIRWSTDEQGEGTTLEVQREACELFIRSQGWTFQPKLVYVDDGVSGGTLDRPGLTALRAAVRARQVSCCVVYKLDRLSRSVLDTVKLVLEEWDGLCFIKSTREPVDTTSPAGKIFFYMLASYAEWERSVIKERTMSGRVKRAQQGKNPGFAYPFGYKAGQRPGDWQIVEAEAAVVRRIFTEYSSGYGSCTIADRLDREGIRTRRGFPWDPSVISRLIRNPMYRGVLQYGRSSVIPPALREREGRVRQRFAEPRFARVEGALPPIVTQELWDAAQAVWRSKQPVKGRKALSSRFLLSGIAKCRCGSPLAGQDDRGRQFYRCGQSKLGAGRRCDCAMVSARLLEEHVISRVRAAFAPYQREKYLATARTNLSRQIEAAEDALASAEESVANLGRRRRRLDADYDAGDLSAKLYNSRVEQLEAEEARLRASREAHELELANLRQQAVTAEEFDEFALKFDGWDSLGRDEQKQLLRLAVDSLTVYRAPGVRRGVNSRAPVEVDLLIKHWSVDGPGLGNTLALSRRRAMG